MRGVSNPFLALPANGAAKPGVHPSGHGPSRPRRSRLAHLWVPAPRPAPPKPPRAPAAWPPGPPRPPRPPAPAETQASQSTSAFPRTFHVGQPRWPPSQIQRFPKATVPPPAWTGESPRDPRRPTQRAGEPLMPMSEHCRAASSHSHVVSLPRPADRLAGEHPAEAAAPGRATGTTLRAQKVAHCTEPLGTWRYLVAAGHVRSRAEELYLCALRP